MLELVLMLAEMDTAVLCCDEKEEEGARSGGVARADRRRKES